MSVESKLKRLQKRLQNARYGAVTDGDKLTCTICYDEKDIDQLRPVHPPLTQDTTGLNIFRSNYLPPANGRHNTLQHYVCEDCLIRIGTACPTCSKPIDWNHIKRHEAHYGLPGRKIPKFEFKFSLDKRLRKFMCISSSGDVLITMNVNQAGVLILVDSNGRELVKVYLEDQEFDWCKQQETIEAGFVFDGTMRTYIRKDDIAVPVYSEGYADYEGMLSRISLLWDKRRS